MDIEPMDDEKLEGSMTLDSKKNIENILDIQGQHM